MPDADTTRSEPFAPSRGTCGGAAIGGRTGFAPCSRPIAWTGTIFFSGPRTTWRAFTCHAHRDHLTDPRPLDHDDQAEAAWRCEQERRGMAGLAYQRVRPLRRPEAR
ncbi:hypothetical protein Ae707Ps1_6077 [Pseudonocardia sp. Ae707_Ps1]|nr:hypothetical protein Ae707Ps1_6077 [Pseudonocardia sp. Ae707_Ps1]